MTSAITVAKYLVTAGFDPQSPDESLLLCPMRLQKMLYYAQGWSLALLGRPLFSQQLEAWKHGPVVPEVFQEFKGKSDGIKPEDFQSQTGALNNQEIKLVNMIFRTYNGYTAKELRNMTHSERPWLAARGGLPDEAKSSEPLSHEIMADFFTEQANHLSRQFRINPREDWEAELAIERGELVNAEDVFGLIK